MKRLFLLAALAVTAAPSAQALVTIKLGTVAPQGSPYDEVLEDMGRKWAEASGGTVKLKIYAGGVAGSEGDMVRKIGVGQLQAASLTTVGMHDIAPEPQVLDVPGLVRSPAEFDYVLSHIANQLEAAVEAKGFVVINWADVGMVRLFSTIALKNPADTAQAKIWAWQGDPAAASGWKAAGFEPVVLSSTDIIPSLETGMINTVAQPPLYAFAAHTFDRANHMLDLDYAILSGATVIKKDTWDRIPADVQQKLRTIAIESGRQLSAKVRAMNKDAIEQMKAQGLNVETPENPAGWQATAEKAWPFVRGKVVPAALFDEVKRLVQEYRAQPK